MSTEIEYAGLKIREGANGRWYVLDGEGFANVLPGATWGRTQEQALQLADVYKATGGNAALFWHLLRAIQRQERVGNAEEEYVEQLRQADEVLAAGLRRAFAESEIPALRGRALAPLQSMDVNESTLRDMSDEDLFAVRDALRKINEALSKLE